MFNALPVVAPGTTIPNNTLNTGDNLLDTKGDGTLNFTAAASTLGVVANPPFASGVTTKGVSTLNVINNAVVVGFPFVAGFAGNVTDLTTVNDNASLGTVQLGQLGQGLNTLLTNVNVSGNYPPAFLGCRSGARLLISARPLPGSPISKSMSAWIALICSG